MNSFGNETRPVTEIGSEDEGVVLVTRGRGEEELDGLVGGECDIRQVEKRRTRCLGG